MDDSRAIQAYLDSLCTHNPADTPLSLPPGSFVRSEGTNVPRRPVPWLFLQQLHHYSIFRRCRLSCRRQSDHGRRRGYVFPDEMALHQFHVYRDRFKHYECRNHTGSTQPYWGMGFHPERSISTIPYDNAQWNI